MNRARILAVTLMTAVLTTLWFASPALARTSLIGAATPDANLELGRIALNVTIAKSDVCGTDASITVDQGDSLYFCYTVTNTGNKVLRFHSLTDNAFGEVLSNVFYELQPGAVFHITKGPLMAGQSFTNAATWSAKRWGNLPAIMASASANVTVLTPEPDKPATVTVAHFAPFAGSVDGTSVSVFVNGGKVFENFKFGDVQKNVELPAGEYLIEIKPTGSDTVAISGSVTVKAGKDYTLAAIGDGANQVLELLPLVDDNEPAAAGAKVRIAHLSPFAADLEATKVDLCTDEGAVVAGGLPYKGVINPVLPAGDYNLKIAVAGTECATVALDLPSIRLADGDIYELYAIGIPGGAIPFTVAAHPDLVLTPEPDKPAMITIALEASPESVRNFRFEGDLGRFRLDDANPDDGDSFGSNKSFEIEPGVYTVKQLVPYRWSLDSIVCTGAAGSVNLDSASVTITVGAGENITCTFTNLRNVFLRIHKYWDRDADGTRNFERGLAGFEFKVYNGAGALVDTQVSNEHGKAHFNHLPAGDYKICETPKDGWTNTQPGGDGCYTLSVGPKRIVVLRFGNVEAGGVTAATAQDVMSGVEFHTDEYIDHDDENYSLNEPFVDADLNTPAMAGKLFLPSVVR
jgi:hypothetical protein